MYMKSLMLCHQDAAIPKRYLNSHRKRKKRDLS